MMEEKKSRGPDPAAVVIEGDWQIAIAKALKKKRPATGWPKAKKPIKKKQSK